MSFQEIQEEQQINEAEALKHQSARMIGRPLNDSEMCKCCSYKINREIVPLKIDIEHLGFIGFGYPQYFMFIQGAIILISIQFLTVGHFMLIANYNNIFRLSQQSSDVQQIQDVLAFTTTIFMLCYMIFFRHNQKKLDTQCDGQINTPGDYTLLVMNLPKEQSREDLEEKLKSYFYGIAKISYLYHESSCLNLGEMRTKSFQDLEKEYFTNGWFSGSALISFQFKSYKQQVLINCNKKLLQYYLKIFFHLDLNTDGLLEFQNREIRIRQAPEPTDINWKKLRQWMLQSNYRRSLDIMINWLLLLLLILVTCFIKFEYLSPSWIGLSAPLQTTFNFLILPHLTKYINIRRYVSWTEKCKNKSFKLTIIMSVSTILFTYNLQGEIFTVMCCNAFLPAIFVYLNPSYKLRFFFKRNSVQDQASLNKLYEYSDFHIGRNHAYVTQTLLLTYFYGFQIPAGQLISILGLTLFYWTNKYILLRYSSVKHQPSSELSMHQFSLVSFIPLVYSCQHYLIRNDEIIPIVQLVIVVIFNIIPLDYIVDFIWKNYSVLEVQEYNVNNFQIEYDRVNPVLQDVAVNMYVSSRSRTIARRTQLISTDPKIRAKQKKSLEKQLQKVERQLRLLEISRQRQQESR